MQTELDRLVDEIKQKFAVEKDQRRKARNKRKALKRKRNSK